MEEIKLKYEYRNLIDGWYQEYTTNEEIQVVKDLIDSLLLELKTNGFIYVKITKGQKKDSIAKFIFDKEPYLDIKIRYESTTRYRAGRVRNGVTTIQEIGDTANVTLHNRTGYLKWDNRTNKPKADITDNDVVWLKGYYGDTLWNVKSSEDRKNEELQKPVLDIDNNILNVGDVVVYINARYGSGMKLCTGIIDRLEAEYHKNDDTVSIYTIVKNIDNGEESKISNSPEFIYKKR